MRTAGHKNWKNAGMVMCPSGLAVLQGDLAGKMAWDEIRDIRCGAAPRSGANAGRPGPFLVLKIEGATIHILDIYDRPLAIIHREMMRYWDAENT